MSGLIENHAVVLNQLLQGIWGAIRPHSRIVDYGMREIEPGRVPTYCVPLGV